MSVRVEVCVESASGAKVSEQAGATRVELCSALVVGGLTPSLGSVITTVGSVEKIGVHVLIRPREGDFVFSPSEIDTMITDITVIRRETQDAAMEVGFVLGALTTGHRIDRTVMSALIQAAGPACVSFHRAFDITENLDRSLDTLIELGIGRVLSGGGTQRAADGMPVLARLVERAAGRIHVMPGGSIRAHNAAQIVAETGAGDIHFRAATHRANAPAPEGSVVRMNSTRPPSESTREETSFDAVREMVAIVHSAADRTSTTKPA